MTGEHRRGVAVGVRAGIVALALCASTSSLAQVFKCVDAAGRTSYQQAPCTGGQKGGRLDLPGEAVAVQAQANDAAWQAAARSGRAVAGMPKALVRQALGEPSETRPPRPGEGGTEVWLYQKPEGGSRVGFVGDNVAWIRALEPVASPTVADGGKSPGIPALAGDTPGPEREARVRAALAVGRDCREAIAAAGRADREEPMNAPGTSATRYVYTFDPANPNAYAAFLCVGGRVTSVERSLPGR